jgi:RNA polymerase primary sigma factor
VLFETDAGDRLFHMAKKKVSPKKKVSAKKKTGAAVKKSAPKKPKKIVKKVAAAKTAPKKIAAKKLARGGAGAKKSTARKVRGITAEVASPMRSSLNDGGSGFGVEPRRQRRGLGSEAAGQSGDTEGISGEAEADSESVEELLEEGQSLEAEVVSGVESAGNADDGGVRTHEVPEDDVPEEYDNQD